MEMFSLRLQRRKQRHYSWNKNIANKKTDIEYNIENQTITFTVFDEGNGFDFNDLPDPLALKI